MRHLTVRLHHRLVVTALALVLGACSPSHEERADAPYPEPVQSAVARDIGAIVLTEQYWLVPVAHFEVDALVRGTERYRFDSLAEVSPVDLALAWGPLADPLVTLAVSISQSGRWFYWQTRDDVLYRKLGRKAFIESMANMHIIPADGAIRDQVLAIKKGQAIRARGLLVDVQHQDFRLNRRTSRTRSDSGAGGCEIFYVTELEVFETPG